MIFSRRDRVSFRVTGAQYTTSLCLAVQWMSEATLSSENGVESGVMVIPRYLEELPPYRIKWVQQTILATVAGHARYFVMIPSVTLARKQLEATISYLDKQTNLHRKGGLLS